MKKIKWLVLWVSVLGFCMATVSCGKSEDTSEIDSVTPDPDEGTDPDAPVVNDNFEIAISGSPSWSTFMHESGSTTEGCRIDKNSTANQYLDCILEVPEGSLYANDLVLDINLPAQLCRNMRFRNYYYYNWKIGVGPDNIWIRNLVDGAGEPVSPFKHCSTDGIAFGLCSTVVHEFRVDDATPVCAYNYTPGNESYPNCCVGRYNLTTETYDTVGTVVTDSATTTGSWGAAYDQQCFGGTASRDGAWPKNIENRPVNMIYSTWDAGYTDGPYTLLSPISLTRSEYNLFVANHLGAASPIAVLGYNDDGNPATGDQDSIQATNAYYSFDCLDEGHEVLHSIDLRIREWDTFKEYETFVSTGVGSPNLSGVENGGGVNDCDFEDPSGGLCNDILDWDDIGNLGFPFSSW